MSHEEQNFKNEIPDAEDAEFRQLFGSLGKVAAPPDFDFKLKARIANSKPETARPGFGWATRLVLPAAAVLVISGFFIYGGLFGTDVGDLARNEVPPLEKTVVPVVDLPIEPKSPEPARNSDVSPPANVSQVSAANSPVKPTVNESATAIKRTPEGTAAKEDKIEAGSIELSAKPPEAATVPIDASTRAGALATPVDQKVASLSARDVLSINGIAVELDGQKWVVRSVAPNSVGESSGVLRNDVIDAINDQPISRDTVFAKSLTGKSITVTRSGTTLRLPLRTKQ